MTILELLESLGIENAQEVAKKLDENVDSRIEEMENQYEIKLAQTATRLQEEADKAAQKELDEHKENLLEWHNQVIQSQLEECDNQLKIAAEVRDVRAGMEKVMEGLKQIGINSTQMFENVAAAEVISLQDKISQLEEELDKKDYVVKAFNRAWIFEQATRGLTDVERDKLLIQADAIDESINIDRYKTLVENLVTVHKSLTKQEESKKDSDLEKTVSQMDEDEDYGIKFQSAPRQERDINSYFA